VLLVHTKEKKKENTTHDPTERKKNGGGGEKNANKHNENGKIHKPNIMNS
jgi:hypothetical protein